MLGKLHIKRMWNSFFHSFSFHFAGSAVFASKQLDIVSSMFIHTNNWAPRNWKQATLDSIPFFLYICIAQAEHIFIVLKTRRRKNQQQQTIRNVLMCVRSFFKHFSVFYYHHIFVLCLVLFSIAAFPMGIQVSIPLYPNGHIRFPKATIENM